MIPGPGPSTCCRDGQERNNQSNITNEDTSFKFLHSCSINSPDGNEDVLFNQNLTLSSHCGTAKTNLTSIHEDMSSIAGLTQWVGDLGIWHCHELWCTLAAAALIQPLTWELPYAMSAALKSEKKN